MLIWQGMSLSVCIEFTAFAASFAVVAKHRDHVQQIIGTEEFVYGHTEQGDADESYPTTPLTGNVWASLI